MWNKLGIIFHPIVFICVVDVTAINMTRHRLDGNSSSCAEPIACKCPNGNGFAVSNVVNCTDSTQVCVTHMKDRCPNQGNGQS